MATLSLVWLKQLVWRIVSLQQNWKSLPPCGSQVTAQQQIPVGLDLQPQLPAELGYNVSPWALCYVFCSVGSTPLLMSNLVCDLSNHMGVQYNNMEIDLLSLNALLHCPILLSQFERTTISLKERNFWERQTCKLDWLYDDCQS